MIIAILFIHSIIAFFVWLIALVSITDPSLESKRNLYRYDEIRKLRRRQRLAFVWPYLLASHIINGFIRGIRNMLQEARQIEQIHFSRQLEKEQRDAQYLLDEHFKA